MKNIAGLLLLIAALSPARALVIDPTILNANRDFGDLTSSVIEFQGSFVQRSGAKPEDLAVKWTDTFAFHMTSPGNFIFGGPFVFNSDPARVSFEFTSPFSLTGPTGPELDPFNLAVGDYVLTIKGTTGGTGGSAYYTGTASAEYINGVPEPSTYALMLLGLAGIGFAARRRMA